MRFFFGLLPCRTFEFHNLRKNASKFKFIQHTSPDASFADLKKPGVDDELLDVSLKYAGSYKILESAFALFVALLINIAIIAVSGTVCHASNLSAENMGHCNDLTLNSATFLLKNVLGKSSAIVYAIALLASGQSSTITGTYAGQFIMQGFLEIKMKGWIRNLMTRCIMILSFELPFAIVPLLKFSSSKTKMGPHKNSIYVMEGNFLLVLILMSFRRCRSQAMNLSYQMFQSNL